MDGPVTRIISISKFNLPILSTAFSFFQATKTNQFFANENSDIYNCSVERFPDTFGKSWTIMILYPQHTMPPLFSIGFRALLFVIWLSIIFIFSWILQRLFIRPIHQIKESLHSIKSDKDHSVKLKTRIKEFQHIEKHLAHFKDWLNSL